VSFVTSLVPGSFGSTLQLCVLVIWSLAFILAGLVLIFLSSMRAWKLWPDWRNSLMVGLGTPAIVLLTIALEDPTLWIGNRAYIWGTVVLGQGWLDETVAEVVRKPPAISSGKTAFFNSSYLPYIVDVGPPVRVAFQTNPGLLDNWAGIVFDPTGKVMSAHGWDTAGKFYAPDAVTKLFDGDIVECEPLVVHYYYCSFT